MAQGSHVLVEDPGVDLEIAEAEAAELEQYIVREDVYRTLIVRSSSGDQNIRMTGGDLLARLHRLQHERAALDANQQSRLDAAQQQTDSTIYAYKTRFHQRLHREMKARLNTLKWFFDECGPEDRQRCRAQYPFEMRNRQRIEEILKQVGSDLPEELKTGLRKIDGQIKAIAQPSEFIWSTQVKNAYPRETYWYLYMLP